MSNERLLTDEEIDFLVPSDDDLAPYLAAPDDTVAAFLRARNPLLFRLIARGILYAKKVSEAQDAKTNRIDGFEADMGAVVASYITLREVFSHLEGAEFDIGPEWGGESIALIFPIDYLLSIGQYPVHITLKAMPEVKP